MISSDRLDGMAEASEHPLSEVKRRPLLMSLVLLLRPKQWTKNLLVFAAWIFTASVVKNPASTPLVLLGFLAMCLASSATYIFNDIADVERDRAHPKKRNRPIASGAIPVPAAIATGLLLLVISVGIAFYLSHTTGVILLSYLILQIIYNLGLKHVPVADVFIISLGFVLRAALGAAAISATISTWLLFCTGALALMLGFAKRRNEYIHQGDNRALSRESLEGYSKGALDALVIMFACGAALCYGVYAVDSTTAKKFPAIILTSIFVFYGICRYVLIVFGRDEGGEPENLLFKDRHILFSILMFVITAVLALSGFKIPLLEQ